MEELLQVTGAEGVPIAVRLHRAPDPHEVPVLLVHGFSSSGPSNWGVTGWLARLERAGRTSVTVDLRGHGSSGKPHQLAAYRPGLLLSDLINALAALPDVLGPLPGLDLIGYSLGGRLVAELAVASTDPAWALPPIRRAVIGGYDGRALFDDVDPSEFRAGLAGAPGRVVAGGRADPARRVAELALASPRNDLTALTALVDGMQGLLPALPGAMITVPTLVGAGDRDEIAPGAAAWAASMADGTLLTIPGRNHITAIPSKVFRSAVVDFLDASKE